MGNNFNEFGEGGRVYNWLCDDADLPEALAITEGVGNGSTITVRDTGDVYMFNIAKGDWKPFGG